MFLKKKSNLSYLAVEVSRNLSVVTIENIYEAVNANEQKNPTSCFRIFFLSHLMTWSIASLMLKNEEDRQICLAICDQLPYRYAELNVLDGLNAESIRIIAEQSMSNLVQTAQEKNQNLMTRLGFWVADKLQADAVSTMALNLHFIEKVTECARIVAKVRKKHRIIYDIKY